MFPRKNFSLTDVQGNGILVGMKGSGLVDRAKFVALVNALLGDDSGISEEAYKALLEVAEEFGLARLVNFHTDAVDGRYYFEADFSLS